MPEKNDYTKLPAGLPEPEGDGAARHLPGATLPAVALASTSGGRVTLAEQPGWAVVHCYPLTGRPTRNVVPDGWDDVPGASGCTPQSCAFRDRHAVFRSFGAAVYGLSVQETPYQREAKRRLRLPFDLLRACIQSRGGGFNRLSIRCAMAHKIIARLDSGVPS